MIIHVTNSTPVLSFGHNPDAGFYDEDFYVLRVNGEKVIGAGPGCPTCPFLYSRLKAVTPPLSANELTDMLRAGVEQISQPLIDTVSAFLGTGMYVVQQFELTPRLINASTVDHYRAAGGVIEMPCFQGRSFQKKGVANVEETILPLFALENLNQDTIHEYMQMLEQGKTLTALALSIVDGLRATYYGQDGKQRLPEQKDILHFLIDGHHKMMAASRIGKSLKLLSFLSLPRDESDPVQDFILHKIYNLQK